MASDIAQNARPSESAPGNVAARPGQSLGLPKNGPACEKAAPPMNGAPLSGMSDVVGFTPRAILNVAHGRLLGTAGNVEVLWPVC